MLGSPKIRVNQRAWVDHGHVPAIGSSGLRETSDSSRQSERVGTQSCTARRMAGSAEQGSVPDLVTASWGVEVW